MANSNFFGQLRETRLSETVENIAGERLKVASTQNEIKSAFEEAYSDLGYKAEIKFSTPEETPELKDKAGTAYVSSTGVHTMIININAKENSTKSGLIGTISEEGSHIINGAKGRQIETGTEEKGLESTGRATNSYFQDKYKDDKTTISMKSDGAIDTSKLGVNVGDRPEYEDIFTIKNSLYKGLSDNQIVEKVGKDYNWEGVNYRNLVEEIMQKDHDNSLLSYIKDHVGEKITIAVISTLARKYLIGKGLSNAAATKAGGWIAFGLFTVNEVSKLKEFRNFGSNGRAALILALGKERERFNSAVKAASWEMDYIKNNFYNGAKKIVNENNFDIFYQTEYLLWQQTYEKWPKKHQEFFKNAINASGKGKELNTIIKSQKRYYRFINSGYYKNSNGENIYYPAGSPNWYNRRNGETNWNVWNSF